jgi:hypothetical protein
MTVFRILVSILALTVSIDQTRVYAFATASSSSINIQQQQQQECHLHPHTFQRHCTRFPVSTHSNNNNILRRTTMSNTNGGIRGGGSALKAESTDAAAPATPPKNKRVRITALDGIRALLALHIVLGHFLRYANPPGMFIIGHVHKSYPKTWYHS